MGLPLGGRPLVDRAAGPCLQISSPDPIAHQDPIAQGSWRNTRAAERGYAWCAVLFLSRLQGGPHVPHCRSLRPNKRRDLSPHFNYWPRRNDGDVAIRSSACRRECPLRGERPSLRQRTRWQRRPFQDHRGRVLIRRSALQGTQPMVHPHPGRSHGARDLRRSHPFYSLKR